MKEKRKTESWFSVDVVWAVSVVAALKSLNSPFHGSWKVTKLLHETEAKVALAQLEKWKYYCKKETY